MMNHGSTKANKPRSGLNSGLDVLECVASRHRPLTLTEIAVAVGMSKSSVHQVLATLERRGFVKRLADQGYCIGIKAWEIGCVAAPIDMARTAAPHMAQLVREVRDGVSLGVLDGAEMVCVHLVESPRAIRVHSNVGDRTPAHCVSAGLAILSTMDDNTVSRLLPDALPRATDETIVDRAALLKELGRVRARGYSISRGAWRLDVAGVSIPVRGRDHHVVAALCIAAPSFHANKEWVARVVPALKIAAANIERDFGVLDPVALPPSIAAAVKRK
ncbi:MAG: IclR family transcriptional regulator [Hyphomicrobiaceae bacterium]